MSYILLRLPFRPVGLLFFKFSSLIVLKKAITKQRYKSLPRSWFSILNILLDHILCPTLTYEFFDIWNLMNILFLSLRQKQVWYDNSLKLFRTLRTVRYRNAGWLINVMAKSVKRVHYAPRADISVPCVCLTFGWLVLQKL